MGIMLALLVFILSVATGLLVRKAVRDRRRVFGKPMMGGDAQMRNVLARLRRQSVRMGRI